MSLAVKKEKNGRYETVWTNGPYSKKGEGQLS